MKNRRILAVLTTAIAAAAVASFLIPAAVGASPQAKRGSDTTLCTATGKTPMGNKGVVSLSAKGKGSNNGTPVSCTAKVKGKWAKNSTTFAVDAKVGATLGNGGAFSVDPKANLSPFTGKVMGTLTGGGLSTGSAIWVEFHCWYSYPPLRYGCEIIIHTGPPPTG